MTAKVIYGKNTIRVGGAAAPRAGEVRAYKWGGETRPPRLLVVGLTTAQVREVCARAGVEPRRMRSVGVVFKK